MLASAEGASEVVLSEVVAEVSAEVSAEVVADGASETSVLSVAGEVVVSVVVLPQPAKAKTSIMDARITAKVFFIVVYPPKIMFCVWAYLHVLDNMMHTITVRRRSQDVLPRI